MKELLAALCSLMLAAGATSTALQETAGAQSRPATSSASTVQKPAAKTPEKKKPGTQKDESRANRTPLQEAQDLLAKITKLRDADDAAMNADERRKLLERADELCDKADAAATDDAAKLEAFNVRWALADRAFNIEDWSVGVQLYGDALPYMVSTRGADDEYTLRGRGALAACLAGVQRTKPWDKREYEPALKLFREVADARERLFRQALGTPGEGPLEELVSAAAARRDIGITLFDGGTFEAAKDELMRAHRLLCENVARLGDPEALRQVANDLFELRSGRSHKEFLERTIKLIEERFPKRRDVVLSLRADLAAFIREEGRVREAVEMLRAILKESEELSDPSPTPMIRTLQQSGAQLGVAGWLEEEERADRRALEVARQAGVDPISADVQNAALDLAVLLGSKGSYGEAMELIQGIFPGQLQNLTRLQCRAKVRSSAGYFDEALEDLEQIESIAGHEVAWQAYGTAGGLLNSSYRRRMMAGLHLAAGRAGKGLAILEDLHSAVQLDPESQAEVPYVLMDLSSVHLAVGDPTGAYALASESLERILELDRPNDIDIQRSRMALGNCALFLGRFSEAEGMARAARDALIQTDRKQVVEYIQACVCLAEALTAAGKLDEAQSVNDEGLRAASALYLPSAGLTANLRASSGAILLAKGDPRKALPLLREGLSAMEKAAGAQANDENDAYYRGKLLCALAGLDTTDELRAEVAVVVLNSKDRVNLMSILSARERGEAITGPLRQAEQIVALRNGRVNVISDRTLFEWLATLRAASGPLEAVQLSGNDAEIRRMREDALHARQRVAAKSLGLDHVPGIAGERLFQQAIAECDTAEHKLVERLPPGSRFAWIDAGDLAITLRAQDALGISVHRIRASPPEQLEDRYLAFVLDGKANPKPFDLGPAKAIEEKIRTWRQAVTGQERGRPVSEGGPDVQTLGSALRAAVLDPLLQGSTQRRVYLCLDDALHTIPWDALPASPETARAEQGASPEAKGKTTDAKVAEFVGDRYRIAELCSFRDLLEISKRAQRTPALLALGAIDYSAPGAAARDAPPADRPLRGSADVFGRFDPLLASEDEIDGIKKYFDESQKGKATILKGSKATKEALFAQAKDATYLHISTHGYFASEELTGGGDRGAGMLSSGVSGFAPLSLCGLALAGANRDVGPREEVVGIVTAEELAGLGLSSCRLAVLSGCDTNMGVRRAGQDLASLKSALHAAGARNVVASLWEVPDAQTSKLMVRFYEGMWKLNLPPDEALWEAKRSLRKQPLAAWAGWVFSGVPEAK